MVFALLSVQPDPPEISTSAPTMSSDEVAVPIIIDSPAIASTLAPGDVIDVFSVTPDGRTSLVAASARVLERPGTSGLGGPDAVVVIAVRDMEGRTVATATGRLGVVIRQRGQLT